MVSREEVSEKSTQVDSQDMHTYYTAQEKSGLCLEVGEIRKSRETLRGIRVEMPRFHDQILLLRKR